MDAAKLRMGEFALDQIGLFDFRPEDFQSTSTYFGLGLAEVLPYCPSTKPRSGTTLPCCTAVYLSTSSGVLSGIAKKDGVYHDPRGERFLRGGLLTEPSMKTATLA